MDAWARLNLFQRMMLRWRDLHPYNPVHVVRVPAALDAERLRACIAGRLEALGLTGLAVDPAGRRFRFEAGPAAVDLTVATGGSDPRAELSRTIERELNRPFAAPRHAVPFRFFAIDEGSAFQLGIVYDHFVASGDSIARLLTAIACSIAGRGEMALATPPVRDAATYRSVALRHPLWVMRATLSLPRMVASARRACRVPYTGLGDGHNAYTYLRIGPPKMNALLGTAKDFGVTLNELLTACLMLALSPLAAERHRGQRRNEIGIASILNMRADFRPDAQDALSPCLAAFRVSHRVPDGIGLQQLAQEVHAEAARIRRGHLYLQSLAALGVSAMLWPVLTPARRQAFYPKHFPVWAGITSLNLNAIWNGAECADASRLDYLRAVPTGPLCPMVLALTTAHDVLHVGIAFRTAAFSPLAVDGLAADFQRSIDRLAAEAPS